MHPGAGSKYSSVRCRGFARNASNVEEPLDSDTEDQIKNGRLTVWDTALFAKQLVLKGMRVGISIFRQKTMEVCQRGLLALS